MAIALFRNRVMLPFFMLKFTHVAIFFTTELSLSPLIYVNA